MGNYHSDCGTKLSTNEEEAIQDIDARRASCNPALAPGIPNWVSAYLVEHPYWSSEFATCMISDEVSFNDHHSKLNPDIGFDAANWRFNFLADHADIENPKELLEIAPRWLLDMHISHLECTVRLRNVIATQAIYFVNDLKKYSVEDWLHLPNMGRKSLRDLSDIIIKAVLDGPPPSKDAATMADNGCTINSSNDLSNTQSRFQTLPNWVNAYLFQHPDQNDIFLENAISNDETFLEHCHKLDGPTIIEIENWKFDYLLKYVDNENPIELLEICPQWLLEMDIGYFECDTRLRNTITKYNIKFLNDFGQYSAYDLFRLKNFGRKSFTGLAASIKKAVVKGPPPSGLTSKELSNGKSGFSNTNLYTEFNRSVEKIKKDSDRVILEQRIGVNGPVKTLQEIAETLGITRERVRQIQKKVISKMIDKEYWDDYLAIRINELMDDPREPVFLDTLSREDSWFSGFEGDEDLLRNIIIHFSHTDRKCLAINNRLVLSNIDSEIWDAIKKEIVKDLEYSLDLGYTYEDIHMLIESKLSHYKSIELSDLLFDEISPKFNFTNIDNEIVLSSIGNTLSSHLKAILDESPNPMHYSEIHKIYTEKYGIDVSERNIHARLSYGDFILFNRGTFGNKKHISIEEYEQEEIIEKAETFLENNSGRQCHIDEILKHIDGDRTKKWEINYVLQKSRKLSYLGKLVWIYGACDADNLRLPVRETVATILRDNGHPMHIDALEREISKVRSVSKDFAMNLQPNDIFSRTDPSTWGLLSRDFVLTETEWKDVKMQLFEHLSRSKSALHTSELNKLLAELKLDRNVTLGHAVGVLTADERFRKWRGGFIGLSSWETCGRLTINEAAEIVLSQIRSTQFSTDMFETALQELLGYQFEKNRLAPLLNEKGYEHNQDTKLWKKA